MARTADQRATVSLVTEQQVGRPDGVGPAADGPQQRGSQALADSLQLQRAAQKRAVAAATGRGRRRKGEVIDLDQMTVVRTRRRRIFMTLLVVEAIVAVIAVGVLVAYVLMQGDQIS
jgi:hypothetical protein